MNQGLKRFFKVFNKIVWARVYNVVEMDERT